MPWRGEADACGGALAYWEQLLEGKQAFMGLKVNLHPSALEPIRKPSWCGGGRLPIHCHAGSGTVSVRFQIPNACIKRLPAFIKAAGESLAGDGYVKIYISEVKRKRTGMTIAQLLARVPGQE